MRWQLGSGERSERRISRLAWGVSTENLHTSHDPYAKMNEEELAQELQRPGIDPTERTLQ